MSLRTVVPAALLAAVLVLTPIAAFASEGSVGESAPTVPSEPAYLGVDAHICSDGPDWELVWVPPDDDGGSAVIEYLVRSVIGGVTREQTVPASQTSLEFDFASNNMVFDVYAINALGAGPAAHYVEYELYKGRPSNPGPPQNLQAVQNEFGSLVTWEAAGLNGSTCPITAYAVSTPSGFVHVSADTFSYQSPDVGTFCVEAENRGFDPPSSCTSSLPPPVLTPAIPTITGSADVGKTLTAKPGAWSPGTTFAYQWLADGKAIPRATGPTSTLTLDQLGKRITVVVTGYLAWDGAPTGYVFASRTSAPTSRVTWSAAKEKACRLVPALCPAGR